MTASFRPIAEIASYHAHVYFSSEQERETAGRVRAGVSARFAVRMGRWHEVPVGPHASAMYQIAFETGLLGTLLPWLMLNHGGLSILIHPSTTHPRRDHLQDGLWLGKPLPLHADRLPEYQSIPDAAGEPNTIPDLS